MAKVRKAQQILDSLERSSGLTPEGRDWLITAVDPFHDTNIRPAGYPDVIMAGSVVQLIKQQMTIACPASVTSGTWDVNIFNLPWLDAHTVSQYTVANSGGDILASSGVTIASTTGGIVAVAGATTGGTVLNLSTANAGLGISSIALDATYQSGPARVIAQGFEVTNTTADIYKQGSVTAWMMPQPTRGTRHCMRINSGTTASPVNAGSVACEWRQFAPGNLKDAQLLAGSRVWDAREGAYIVLRQNDMQLRDPFAEPILPQMIDSSTIPPAYFTGLAVSSAGFVPYTQMHDHNMGGAFFSGLSLQTTLTVTWNVYLERFPTASQKDLVVMAQPSCRYDPVALELYTRMLADMPVGVPVRENGLGTWFAESIAAIAPVVSGVLSAVPHPLAQAGSVVASTAGKAASKFLAPPNSKGDPLTAQRKAKQKKAKKKARAAVKAVLQ